jgi:predicted hydrocarbon binding protein
MNDGRDSTKLVDPNHALGAVCAAMIDRFGGEAEAIIRDLCARRGLALGEKLASILSERSFRTGVEAFVAASLQSKTPAEIVSLTDRRAVVSGERCPLGLQGKGLSVCRAMMAMDTGILEVACGRPIRVTIEKSVAKGDDRCLVVFEPV